MESMTKMLIESKAPFILLTGAAGSGKSYLVREAINCKPEWGILCATTGVAARVLATNFHGGDVKTIHSTLGFFNYDSLVKSYKHGTLVKNLQQLKKKVQRIVIDECSMLDSCVFELLVQVCEEVGIGLVIVGDFLQLPAIKPKPPLVNPHWKPHLFQMPAFKKFEVIKLTTQYRQNNPEFIKALNALRAGDGAAATPFLKQAGVNFVLGGYHTPMTANFNGTTLAATNHIVDAINSNHYGLIKGDEYTIPIVKTGQWTDAEWHPYKDLSESVSLKFGARVMVLRNLYGEMILDPTKTVDTDSQAVTPVLFNEDGSVGVVGDEVNPHALLQSNGDTGVIESADLLDDGTVEAFRLKRDDGASIRVAMMEADNGEYHTEIHEDGSRHRIVDKVPTGWVRYMPLRHAWATTVHKAQGLTIEHPTRIFLADFFGDAMAYVAASRVKNPKHLTLLGDIEGNDLAKVCKSDPACEEFI